MILLYLNWSSAGDGVIGKDLKAVQPALLLPHLTVETAGRGQYERHQPDAASDGQSPDQLPSRSNIWILTLRTYQAVSGCGDD
jgi:hypothetical protein